jgi:hypothetical protein
MKTKRRFLLDLRLRSFLTLSALFCLILATAGCQPRRLGAPWTVEDLRLLDPLDASAPEVEILAVYTRTLGKDVEIRLDLLDIRLTPDYDLKISLTAPGEEITLLLPPTGRPTVTSWTPGMRVRVSRDPWLDTVTVRLNRLFIPQPFSVQAAAYLPGQASPADETALVRSDALPPVERAPVVLAFWDVFPAATPAQALRRWDGAHTGPHGGRHGLRHLLDSVEEYELPVVLLDLMNPASLAALDLTGGALDQVKRLASAGLLVLPGTACGQPADVALDFSREAAVDFDLPGSLFVYACGAGLQPDSQTQFFPLSDPSHLGRSGAVRLIPVPSEGAEQATSEGLSLEVRRALVEAALSPDPADLVTLGGSLPDSTWGAYDMAGVSFAWLRGHPWVKVLGGYDLMTFPTGGEVDLPEPPPTSEDPWLEALRLAPDNAITRSAWQASLMLHSPEAELALQSLREAYAGQVGILLAAAEWAEAPARRADCSTDPDQDGRVECILSNESYFAVIETNGARLTHLFLLDEGGAHQLVAPTSQFTVGLSDPSEWHPERGDAADPGALMGAFSDMVGTYDEYTASFSGEVLTLAKEGMRKTFRLSEGGVEVRYQAAGQVSLRLPLAVDPETFYTGAGDYQAVLAPGTWTWGPGGGLHAEVWTDEELTGEGFTVSQVFLNLPEDPDQEYPMGHYFPFPLSMVTVRGEGEFVVWIRGK